MRKAYCSLAYSMTNIVMLGGQGRRLEFLTKHGENYQQAKPAVQVFGKYRIVDFIFSNLLNSGCGTVIALLQYGAQSLSDYLSVLWGRQFDTLNYAFPPQGTPGNVYQGTADAVRQVLWQLEHGSKKLSEVVGIWAGDHITKFDVNPFLDHHLNSSSRFTVAVMPIPIEQAYRFGVVEVDEMGCIIGFQEKPGSDENPHAIPTTIPGNEAMVYASLGNYIVDKDYLQDILRQHSEYHDFGGEVIPAIIESGRVFIFDMSKSSVPGNESFYWEDIGTVEAYHSLHMQMMDPVPPVNLRNREWPIHFSPDGLDPARFIGSGNDIGACSIAGGCLIQDTRLHYAQLSRECAISGANIEESVLFDRVIVEKECDLHRVIVDKGVHIPQGVTIGRDYAHDASRGFFVDHGARIVIVPRYYEF